MKLPLAFRERAEREERLRKRHTGPGKFTDTYPDLDEVLDVVAESAVHPGGARQPVTVPNRTDITDALALIREAEERAKWRRDENELALIEAARAVGMDWGEIGQALGYEPRNAARSAQQRHQKLNRAGRGQGRWTITVDTGSIGSANESGELT